MPKSRPGALLLAVAACLLVLVPAGSAAHRGAPDDPVLTWHGGPVMPSTTVYAVFWVPNGFTLGAAYQAAAVKYLKDVAGASGTAGNVYGVVKQHSIPGTAVKYSVAYGGSVVATDPLPRNPECTAEYAPDGGASLAGCLANDDFTAELSAVLTRQGWTGGLKRLFFVFTPQNVGSCTILGELACSHRDFCGYHDFFLRGGQDVVWADIPYPLLSYAPATACDVAHHPNGGVVDAALATVAREHLHAVSDPLYDAWWDSTDDALPWGRELGDRCAGEFGLDGGLGSTANDVFNQIVGSGRYYLQQTWSNPAGECVAHGPGPRLKVSSFTPTSGPVGTVVTVRGAGLLDSTAVTVNQAATDREVLSDTQLRIRVPDATTGPIKVFGSANNGANGQQFRVTPKITGLSVPSGQVGTAVTITGTTLDGAATVKFGSVKDTAFTLVSRTQIMAHVPATATVGPVSVTTPSGTSTAPFGVLPTIDTLAPAQGAAGTVVTLTGKTLGGVSKVTFGGAAGTIRSKSPAKVTVIVPSTAATGPVTVTNKGGSTVSAATFTVLPVVSSFSPASGAPGKLVQIRGTGLGGAFAVAFGGMPSTAVTAVSPTEVDATVPPGAVTGKIHVTTPAGGADSKGAFKVTAAR